MHNAHAAEHRAYMSTSALLPGGGDLLRAGSRRWFLQTGLGGLAGLSLADMLRSRAQAATSAAPARTGADRKAVILFWLSGGPSHIDMWDPKPAAPIEIRGPYQPIATKVPGIEVCEHLPLQAGLMDKLTIIRSVDCSASNHTPITFQAFNALARRTDDGNDGAGYPSIGSIAAKFRGPNDPSMPGFVGLADSWTSDIWGAGHMGGAYEPVKGAELAGRLKMPKGLSAARLQDRQSLRGQFETLRKPLDQSGTLDHLDRYQQMAYEMVTDGRVEKAFDVSQESDAVRDAYGRTSVGEKGLLARRLVEAGVTFIVVSGAWGYFDHHGDDVRWFGIEKGLTPILPTVDRVLAALVADLAERGLLDSTLVMMLGEFGRGPVINKQAGRDHWTNCMSLVMAGGGYRHGQVIGSTDSRGYAIATEPVRPGDLAATIYHHLDIDPNVHWTSPQGRPTPIVTEGGQLIRQLV